MKSATYMHHGRTWEVCCAQCTVRGLSVWSGNENITTSLLPMLCFMLVCAGLGASATALGDPFLPPWQALGFSAPNPAAELADTGLLALLHLLLLADRAPRLAGQLLESSTLGLPTAVAAVQATAWTLRLLRSGELAGQARQLRSTELATGEAGAGALWSEMPRAWRCVRVWAASAAAYASAS